MRRDDYTDIGGTGGAFLTTHWSLIKEAGSSDEQNNRALVSLLLNRYWKPIYCYLPQKNLIELYETLDKPEKAEKRRAKLPQNEAVER